MTDPQAPAAPPTSPGADHEVNAAAFFDLDRTLISGSSAFSFGIAAWRNKLIPTGELVSDGVNALTFKLVGATDERSEAVRDRILHAVEGAQQADLLALNEEIVPRILEKVRPESRGLIDMHHEAGRETWIVSASPIELVDPLAKALGMTGAIATRSEVDEGRYTGRLDGPFVYGEGKREAIQALADERGYDLRLSYSYSDSASDLPMMEMVGHPVAVNPDRPLETVAHQRGWPMVVFSRRTKQVVKTTTAVAGAAGLATTTYLLGRRHGRIAGEAERGRALRPWR
ncbi:HAD family hydrolase [Nitriliruptor alkaliphilus]|uniref:HAD family hydrolase n=1 Tax=Nitriliruptor alkaliphilus TaxID=427918 RepID=UPI0009F8572E|nr:HAD-IB family hydrolase [Nitriliruptor alkaliphilus]